MEYRVKVGAWLRRALVWIGGQGEALPLPAGGARERQLGQHVVLSLPEAEPFPIRQTLTAIRQRRHAVPTLPEAVEKGDRGPGCW